MGYATCDGTGRALMTCVDGKCQVYRKAIGFTDDGQTGDEVEVTYLASES